ncbi:MAG: hypothetical protein R3C17_16740 [Planctomycetaceae bacterium]
MLRLVLVVLERLLLEALERFQRVPVLVLLLLGSELPRRIRLRATGAAATRAAAAVAYITTAGTA